MPQLHCGVSFTKLRSDYDWSDVELNWATATENPHTSLICPSLSRLPRIYLHSYAGLQSKVESCSYPYPHHVFNIQAPVEFLNALPTAIHFSMIVQETKDGNQISDERVVESGEAFDVYSVPSQSGDAGLASFVVAFSELQSAPVSVLGDQAARCDPVWMSDPQGRRLKLNLHRERSATGVLRLTLSASFWLQNKSDLELMFAQCLTSRIGPFGQRTSFVAVATCGTVPTLFAFDAPEGRCVVRAKDSAWSAPFSFPTAGAVSELHLQRKDEEGGSGCDQVWSLGVTTSLAPGIFCRTRVVTFAPRRILVNRMSASVRYILADAGTDDPPNGMQMEVLHAQSQRTLHWPTQMCSAPTLSFSRGHGLGWIGVPVSVNTEATEIRVADESSEDGYALMNVSTTTSQGSLFIVCSENRFWPLRIDNLTEHDLRVCQVTVSNIISWKSLFSYICVGGHF